MTEEDEVDLNPVSTRVEVKKKRSNTVLNAPEDGPLNITIHVIVLKGGTASFTKSRFSKEICIPDALKYLSDGDSESPSISAGDLHGLIVKQFAELANDTITKIQSGDGEITEHSLIGNAHADYKFNLSGPFFSVTDCVSLLCSSSTSISVNSTPYGKSKYSKASYGAPFYTAAGLIVVSLFFSSWINYSKFKSFHIFTYCVASRHSTYQTTDGTSASS